jgi:protein ImuA
MSAGGKRAEVVRELAQRLRCLEGAHKQTGAISTGIEEMDRLLPAGGLRWGTLLECLTISRKSGKPEEGGGAGSLLVRIAARLMQDGRALIVVDPGQEFYAPAAVAWGVDLRQMIVVRPTDRHDTLWSLEQALRCPGVAACLFRLDRYDGRVLRRLQLAAEAGGGIGLVQCPENARSQPSWADVRLLVQPIPHTQDAPWLSGRRRRLRVELLRCRNGLGGGAVELDVEAGFEGWGGKGYSA